MDKPQIVAEVPKCQPVSSNNSLESAIVSGSQLFAFERKAEF